MAATTKLLLALFLSFFVSAAFGLRSSGSQLSDAQQCRLQRLTSSKPSGRIESEGGVLELWDENEEQFQCAGVTPLRFIVRPNSIHLPSFHPTPRLVYVLQGKGLFGLTIPGCAETYTSQQQQEEQQQQQQQEEQQQERQQFQQGDQHQRVLSIRKGDVIAVPAGAAHWCANHDEQEDLVFITINDLNHLSNQLDQRLRVFYLAGGLSRQQQQGQKGKQGQQGQQGQQPWGKQGQQGEYQHNFQSLYRGFDPELLSEAFNIPVDTVRKIQREDERGLIVKSQQGLSGILRPGQEGEEQEQQGREQEQEQGQGQGQWGGPYNGLEETFCSMKVHTNIEHRTQADVYSRQAGKVNVVDRHKLPILKYLDLSIEKGNLFPHALVSPLWTSNGHSIIYVIRGDAQVEVVNHNGQNVMNDRVNEGDIVVVPQFFAATTKAGRNGFEWVAIQTTATPMNSPLAGYTSVVRALPLDVVRHSYQASPGEAQQLKLNRGSESILLSSSQQRERSY